MTDIIYRQLTHAEQASVLPLLGKCFPAYWEQRALKLKQFPFDELSFAALDGDKLVGHCGVIEYQISDGNGGTLRCGGIASVAVDPDYRKQGIARKLCLTTIPWAKEQGFDTLTLYTEFFRVYESAGWELYHVPMARHMTFTQTEKHTDIRTVKSLSNDEKTAISKLYTAGEDFRGKVVRGNANEFNSWKRLLNDPDYSIALADGAYALFCDGVMVELFADSAMSDQELLAFALATTDAHSALDVLLPNDTRAWQCLAAAAQSMTDSMVDVMHHERPMFLDLSPAKPHSTTLFYPVGDKF